MKTTELHTEQIVELRKNHRGAVLNSGDEEYDGARRIWNGMIDKRPAIIARCTGTADVMAAVRFAREQGLSVTVRGGGHNVAGNSVCDDGLVIDLSPMCSVRVDPARKVARVAGGGSFGAVTSFEFRMHLVGPEIYFLLTFYPISEMEKVFRFFRSRMPGAPDELMAIAICENAPEEEFIPATDNENIAWVRRWHEKASQFSNRGTYMNFGGFWEGGEKMLAKSFGANYPRMREIMARYDPESGFSQNLKIPVDSNQ